ncbi:MAG TPA: phage major capsid protein, partial [Pirellulaceae bacterium]|nr:phage major capsid protein [Pirellulaceae bacterium]
YAEGADASNFTVDSQAGAIVPWAFYRSNFSVSGFAKAASRTSRTPEGNIDLLARDLVDASAALADKVNKALFTGQSGQTPGQIVGLDEAIGLTNNTYATIDRSSGSNAFFRPYVADPGSSTALTFAQIRLDLASIMKNGGVKPNVALVGPETFNAVGALFDPQRFYMYQTMKVMGGAGEIELEGGVGAIKFDGCYFVEDKDATEGKIYYINTDTVDVNYLPLVDLDGDDESQEAMMTDGVEAIPLGMRVEVLARTGDADKVMLKTYAQLRVRRPNQCGVRKNVAYT